MSATAPRRTALQDRSFAGRADAAARIAELPPAARLVVRGRAGIAEAAAAALGFPLPTGIRSAATGGDVAALWLSPDEWLVIAPDGRGPGLAAALDEALAALPHAVVDVSHRNTAVEIAGPQATFVLNHGNPLYLSLRAFPVGTCCRTLLGKAEVVLWRTGEESFRIEVWRSFASYVAAFLEEARREFEAG